MRPEDSLDIIGQMMSDTRRSVLLHSYMPLLVWGWATVVVSLIVFITIKLTDNPSAYLCWYLIPVLGLPFIKWLQPREPQLKTGISIALQSIWTMLIALIVCFSITSYLIAYNVLFIILLLLSIGSFVTGALIKYPFLKYSSYAGYALSASMWFVFGPSQALLFAVAICIMMIIPGYKIKADLNQYE